MPRDLVPTPSRQDLQGASPSGDTKEAVALVVLLLISTTQKEKKSFSFDAASASGVSVQMKPFTFTACCDVHMICDRTCECRADVISTHALGAMHASEGVPAACAHQSEESSVGFDMKKSSPSRFRRCGDRLRLCRARRCRRCVQE